MSLYLAYLPSIPGNVAFAVVFALSLALQLFLGITYRTWGFMFAIGAGTAGEIAGYVARIMMHSHSASESWFLINLALLSLSPAFLTAAIYLCWARMVVVYGEEKSFVRPRTYIMVFCSFDFVAVSLQVTGGVIGSISTSITRQTGVNIMLAGLGLQVLSLVLFVLACTKFGFRVSRVHNSMDPLPSVATTPLFFCFCGAMATATFVFLIRSIYRVVQLCHGFEALMANDQAAFMLLDNAMVAFAVVALTIFHPGLCFQRQWQGSDYSIRKSTDVKTTDGKRLSASSFSSELSALSEILTIAAPKEDEEAVTTASEKHQEAPESSTVSPTPRYARSDRTATATEMTTDDCSSIYSTDTRQLGRHQSHQAVRGIMVRPGMVNVEMGPLFSVPYEYTQTLNSIGGHVLLGLPYESTRRDLPRPISLT
ncbi:hypothetical protein BP5796_06154 [Coleophoma crateriformis]|uniref:Uncharacterized protein n=1 Tax=Coleophoma crateriformis TaxID=565419 RepID=A0A3D8RW55_9HELO|nr:hypothetical protein BP5796_06154 [Coleophoma crateriformis]